MILRNLLKVSLLIVLTCCFTFTSQAALVDIGNGLIYDNDESRYWYKDLSQFTNMTYDEQFTAIGGISVAPVFGHSHGEFRMANLGDMESLWLWDKNSPAEINDAFIHTDSYEAGGSWHYQHIGRYDLPFEFDFWPGHYFARTVVTYNPDGTVSGYNHNSLDWGKELDTWSKSYFGAWVVADANLVPIPGALWLLGSGILGLFGLRKKYQK